MSAIPPYAAIPHRQEAFSGAYIRAVSAATGCSLSVPEIDHDKIDYVLKSRVVGTVRSKPQIDIQAKCERSGLATTDPISYSLDLETYDNLRDPLVTNPRILVVVLVPPDEKDWLSQSEQELVMSHCGYWISLKGMPLSKNMGSQTIHIPRANVFSPQALQSMMNRVGDGVDL